MTIKLKYIKINEINDKKSAQQENNNAAVSHISLDSIEVNPFQPRADFDETALKELSDSIKMHGVVQPITVRKVGTNKYQLISGERRTRAAKLAGLKEIPAYLRAANDQEMLEIALIENIQREDLNAIEVAIHFRRLLDECNLTHESLAERVGKDRSTVTNFLRLLKLPPEVQRGLKEKKISMGHARAILALEDPIAQIDIYKETITRNLSVRDVELLARDYRGKKQSSTSATTKKASGLSFELKKIQDEMASHLATRVQIKKDKQGKGEIVISFLYANNFSATDLLIIITGIFSAVIVLR